MEKNLVNGTIFEATLDIFGGTLNKPVYLGEANITGKVVSDYYDVNRKHWIKFLVLGSDSSNYEVGKNYRKQGKNLYKRLIVTSQPDKYEILKDVKNSYKATCGIEVRRNHG